MKTLILAAGYATRLYPLTENFPKPLLKVGEKTILDWLIDDIATCGLVDEYIVISNHRFAPHFQEWAEKKNNSSFSPITSQLSPLNSPLGSAACVEKSEQELSTVTCQFSTVTYHLSTVNSHLSPITVLDDGTSTNETRLGAVRDIELAIQHVNAQGNAPTDGYLVIAGDNVLDFSLTHFIRYAQQKGTSCIMRFYEPSDQRLLKCGVVTVNDDDLVINMTEKSPTPATHWACPPFYYYTTQDAQLVSEGIRQGCGTDAPGSYIAWLCTQVPVHAMEMPGHRYDIGNLQSYEEVQRTYKGILS